MTLKLLFVCTSGSRAEMVASEYEKDSNYSVRSCGVYSVSPKEMEMLLSWADKAVCITHQHYLFLSNNFSRYLSKLVDLEVVEQDSFKLPLLLAACKRKAV